MKITTTSNFEFIQDCFIESKLAAREEEQTGVINPDRLMGIGLEGASRTAKSFDTAVFICHYVSTYSGREINICRDHLKKLKDTTYITLKKVWINYFGFPSSHFNKSATDIYFNGNTIRFVGVNDDVMTSHGLESDLLWINETMGVEKEAINQLEQRCNEFFIYDYNPSEVESHVYDKELQPTYKLHKTTIFDNKYAPANARAKILSYAHPEVDDYDLICNKIAFPEYSRQEWENFKLKNLELKTAHKYNWEVYGLGKRAVGEDIIFPDWQVYDDSMEPPDDECEWVHVGGDFGFKVDPTVAVRVKKHGHNLYIRELFYETGLLSGDIASKMRSHGEDGRRSIWDKAQEFTIFELRGLDIDAWYSPKPPGSVSFGIQKMHQHNIFIHKDSKNVKNDFSNFRWAKDRDGSYKRDSYGKRIPFNKNKHSPDAVRYVLLYYYADANESMHESDI